MSQQAARLHRAVYVGSPCNVLNCSSSTLYWHPTFPFNSSFSLAISFSPIISCYIFSFVVAFLSPFLALNSSSQRKTIPSSVKFLLSCNSELRVDSWWLVLPIFVNRQITLSSPLVNRSQASAVVSRIAKGLWAGAKLTGAMGAVRLL